MLVVASGWATGFLRSANVYESEVRKEKTQLSYIGKEQCFFICKKFG